MPNRPGLPKASSVVAEIPFAPGAGAAGPAGAAAAPAAARYTILRTTEVDPNDTPVSAAEVAAGPVAAAAPSDNYTGTSRKAAKLSIVKGKAEEFDDLTDLIDALTPDKKMVNHKPKIGTGPDQNRVDEEKRNVRVSCFLYAASREDDNDFHLILGRDPKAKGKKVYMTMELSGLPPKSASSFKRLSAVRETFKDFFGSELPGTTYDFYDPPIPVLVEGSLFFDMTHAKGSHPGPKSLRDKIPTIWEVHPITEMVFEP
ncbi:MAG TPA: hypothetical protein VF824_21425 [Thermoanaerobaculia bacterium]